MRLAGRLAIFFIGIFLLAPSAVHAAVLTRPSNNLGLAAYWSFNEASGTQATDFSGNKNTGTLSGSTLPAWVSGKHGSALSFDGSSSYVNTGNNASMGFSGKSFTISAWINTKDATTNGSIYDAWQSPFSFRLFTTGGTVAFQLRNTSAADMLSGNWISAAINTNQWYHVVAVYNYVNSTTGTAYLYLNGTLAVSAACSAANCTLMDNIGTIPRLIGKKGDSANYFNGIIDDVRVYSRALSATEITNLYQSGAAQVVAINSNGLTGYWNFNEGSGSTAKDFIETAPTGSIVGSPSWVPGKQGTALSFNGSSQYTDIPLTVNYPAITVSAWFKAASLSVSNSRIVANDHTDTAGHMDGFQLMFNSGGATGFFDVGNGSTEGRATWSQQLSTGTWYHYVGVYDGSHVYAYLNGVQVASASYAGGAIASSPFDVNIGRNPQYAGDYFSGVVDDVRIYSRAMSAGEVAALYTAAIPAGKVTLNTSSANLTNGSTLQSGLVGLWTFDGLDVTDKVYDRSGQGNNGYVGAAGPATSTMKTIGKLGQALNFANGPYLDMGTIGSPGTSDFSVSAWIKTGADYSALSGNIVNTRNVITTSNAGYQLSVNISNKVYIAFSDGSAARLRVDTSAPTINDNAWHLVTATFQRNGNATIYIDGSLASTPSVNISSQPGSVTDSSDFLIGKQQDGSGKDSPFNGIIDDVRLYNRVLSSAEVKQLYLLGQ